MLSDIAGIAGVIAGVKPATIIGYSDEVARLVPVIGLSYISADNKFGMRQMSVARTDELANDLMLSFRELWDNPRAANDSVHRKIGKILGYPDTSTDYFIERGRTLDEPMEEWLPSIEPDEFIGSPTSHFNQLILSPRSYADIARISQKEKVRKGIFGLLRRQSRRKDASKMPQMYVS